MIHTVRVEYMRRHGTPGLLAAVADRYGNIFYENKKALPTTKRRKTEKRETRKPTKP